MSRKHRPSLVELRDGVRFGTISGIAATLDAIDDMHDRIRDEVLRALGEATNSYHASRPWAPTEPPMMPFEATRERVRVLFDRRKRKGRK